MTDRTPTITTEVPTKFDTFVARTTEIDGRTFSAHATEYNDHGEPVERIMLNVHHRHSFPETGDIHAIVRSDDRGTLLHGASEGLDKVPPPALSERL